MSERASKGRKVQIQIKIDEELASGVYANMVMAHHTDAEFTLDFLHLQPQAPLAKVRARVITSPRHVRRLIQVLQDALGKYEAAHGPVDMAPPTPSGEFH